jgi:hypothetical protein
MGGPLPGSIGESMGLEVTHLGPGHKAWVMFSTCENSENSDKTVAVLSCF